MKLDRKIVKKLFNQEACSMWLVIRFQVQSGNFINRKPTLHATGQTHIIFPLLISYPIFSTHASFSLTLTLLISIP